MRVRERVAAILATVSTMLLFGPSAWAVDNPNYPPTGVLPSTAVKGVKVGADVGNSALPSTGFDGSYVLFGLVLLVLGVVLLLASRRRRLG